MNAIGSGAGGGGVFVGGGEGEEQGGGRGGAVGVEQQGGGGVGRVGGGAADRSKAVKAVVGAITETVTVGFTTYYPVAKSLPSAALSVAYAALFLTILLFLAILLLLLLLLHLPRDSGNTTDGASEGGGGRPGGCAVKFAERAAVSVVFLVPLLALAAKAYAVLN